jgi:L-asparaginase
MSRSVRLIALGGTISMREGPDGGLTPQLSGDDLVAAVPGLSKVGDISACSPFHIPGASIQFEHLAQVAELARQAFSGGHNGVVVVQGTDTIEETAFVLDHLVDTDRPIVVTGAMRGADHPGADGSANILAAATYAVSDAAVGLGTVVVVNDEIHAAHYVRKSDTGLPSAFASRPYGPIGRISEGEVLIGMRPARRRRLIASAGDRLPPVALIQAGLGDDGRLVGALPELGFEGAVVVGFGAGHVPEQFAATLDGLVAKMPVVLATRVAAGPVFSRTYGFAGSEIDLRRKGLISAGELGPAKARLLLQLSLAAGLSKKNIESAFTTS